MRIIPDPKNKQVYVQIGNIKPNIIKGIRQSYYQIGKDLKSYANKKIEDPPKTGRVYKIFTRTRDGRRKGRYSQMHIASAAGEFPAKITGELQRSLGFKVTGWNQMEFGAGQNQTQTGRVTANAPYAKWLETGTRKMRPRSYLLRSITERQQISINYFYTYIGKALNEKNG